MQNIKNIIFDYGNVIFNIDFVKAQEAWKQLGISNADVFFDHKQQDEIFNKFDRGEVSANEFRNYIRERSGNVNLTDQQIDTAWNSMLLGVEKGNHELLTKIKNKYRTFLLSNTNAIHYDHIMKYLEINFGFQGNDHLFEKTYYSHLTGMRKPEINIFKMVLKENNLDASQTLFIDDSPQHLIGAEQLGIKTFLLTKPDTIQQFFIRENLI